MFLRNQAALSALSNGPAQMPSSVAGQLGQAAQSAALGGMQNAQGASAFSPFRIPPQYAMPYSDMSMQSLYSASMTTQPMTNPAGYGSGNDLGGYGGKAGYAGREKKELPHRTGELRAAPPDAGALQIALPNESAKVWMDGEAVSSAGLTRYFVTPNLDIGKEATYDIKIEWTQNGESRTQERKVTVAAGKIAVVDFTKKDNSSVTRKSSY
jgi:uncharacterized protein (TIGR03000 family)